MIWIGIAPFVIAGIVAVAADWLAHQMRPSTAVALLTALSLSISLCTGLVLSAAAVLMGAQWGPLPRIGGWSARTLHTGMGFPTAAGIVALIVGATCLAAGIIRAAHAMYVLVAASRSVSELEPITGDLVLVEDEVPTAYSVAALRGRIVVSTSMLASLSAAERRVLIAHEESHLRHRHNLYLQLAGVAAAANPLLRPVTSVIKNATERWADEDAADVVGDRSLAARAVARAALAAAGRPMPRPGLAITDGRVTERVQLLLAPAPTARAAPVVAVVLAGLISWTTAVMVTTWANNLVQLAESVYAHH